MELTSLRIDRLPGIQHPIEQTFLPGANFVIGPNAIGKSSLARALFFLLRGSQANDPGGLMLQAQFHDAETEWKVERSGNVIEWFCEGQLTDAPPLPGQEVLNCYWLTAESLLPPRDADHTVLHQRFREALAGGINLQKIIELAALDDVRFPQSKQKQYQTARERRQSLEREYEALQSQREKIPQLERLLATARAAQDRVRHIEQALSLLEARQNRLNQADKVKAFPAHLAKLRGDEASRAKTLIEDRKAIDQRLAQLQEQHATTQATLENTGLTSGTPQRAELDTAEKALRDIRDQQQSLQAAQARAESANTQIGWLKAQLGNANAERTPIITPALVSELEAVLARQASAANTTSRPARWLLTAIGLGGITSLLLGLWLPHILVSLAGALTLAGLGGLALIHRKPTNAAMPSTATLQGLLAEHGLADTPVQDLGLIRLLDLARQLDTAHQQAADAQAECQGLKNRIIEQKAAVMGFLQNWASAPSSDDALELEGALSALASRASEAREQQTALEQLTARIEDAKRQNATQADAEAQWEALTQLDPRADGAIQALCEQHQAYNTAADHLRTLEITENERRRALTARPELIAQVEADDEAGLKRALDAERALSETADEQQAALSKIRADIGVVMGSDALSRLMAEETAALATLEDRQNQRRMRKAGQWLLKKIEKNYQQAHEPQLARAARERFEAFTQGHWSLGFSDAHEIVAIDLVNQQQRPLDALSSATRMQLLLAARIAWAQDQERLTRPLPFILDEALGNSDPHRFAAAVENLEQLIDEGNRQVIYLSARPEDLQLWTATAKASPHVIDLEAARNATAMPLSYALPDSVAPIPAPADMSAAAYAQKLQVPGIDPAAAPGRIHLFHLLRDDLPSLYAVISDWSLRQWGPTKHWIEMRKNATPEALPRWAETLERRGEIAERWQQLAHQGRGRPVDATALATCATVTTTMLPRITEVAKACHGDAQLLIKQLEDKAVARFGPDKVEALQAHLMQTGYLDSRPPLDDDAIVQRLLATLGHRFPATEIRSVAGWLNAGRTSPA